MHFFNMIAKIYRTN